jgi:hypothetical protein
MNWIDFSKERPKEEPRRRVLVLTKERDAYSMWSNDPFLDTAIIRTHWAEIEPPVNESPLTPYGHFLKWWKSRPQSHHVDCDTQHQTAREAFEAGCMVDKQEQNKPDPFEEWWFKSRAVWDDKDLARQTWDAAIRWKEGK